LHQDDVQLIAQLKRDNEAALRKIYDHYFERVYQLAFRFLKEENWTEEIVQDVFLSVWLHRENLNEEGNLWLYLYVITKRRCLNKLREVKKSSFLFTTLLENIETLASAQHEAEQWIWAAELASFAQKAIDALPQQQQLVYKLSREEGLTHKEIAHRLQISPFTVRNHLGEALKTLRASLPSNLYSILFSFWLTI
jgi:RNA polymerase sigma-70 factor (family 1)